mmetsp:Transcript_31396/g.54468  ORF Transcript_31396/g.54468 Transcript_31396/m.54468 type:complete len:260 (+) Transcript_31396:337-1116(+)|eukprot:CAMPEP_0204908302 /NCGR_PEP_ID=MMETSP1397-20131031/7274_1 /ASSEMBLY_ACC=CAM_ASM_000891 /TAXON_ID=49980 /ORGANISM="Climacostomum Climacostomum virens, Strain Stock W-24" /LENGTH=259 /DNA_ID=CAMNT_0052077767 /DNA_START=273 /DNA_END=1052 /DNA_ORIENTATION=+
MKPVRLAEEPDNDITCRVCLEPHEDGNPLLIPCKCAGSVKYIHENCLKVWLVSKEVNLQKVRCELCKTKYEMIFKFRKLCMPRKLFRENFVHWLFIPLLAVVFCLLILISGIILTKLAKNDGDRAYIFILLGTCGLGCMIILFMCYSSFKEACFSEELVHWTIKSRKESLELKSHDNASSTAVFDVSSNSLVSEVMHVPQTVRIGKKVIKTPIIRSDSLTPIMRGTSVVGYTSRQRSDRFSVDVSQRAYNSARANPERD